MTVLYARPDLKSVHYGKGGHVHSVEMDPDGHMTVACGDAACVAAMKATGEFSTNIMEIPESGNDRVLREKAEKKAKHEQSADTQRALEKLAAQGEISAKTFAAFTEFMMERERQAEPTVIKGVVAAATDAPPEKVCADCGKRYTRAKSQVGPTPKRCPACRAARQNRV